MRLSKEKSTPTVGHMIAVSSSFELNRQLHLREIRTGEPLSLAIREVQGKPSREKTSFGCHCTIAPNGLNGPPPTVQWGGNAVGG